LRPPLAPRKGEGPPRSWRPGIAIWLSAALHILAVIALLVRPQSWPSILTAVLLNHVVLALIGLWPKSRLLGDNMLRLPEAAAKRNEIALTFDDGPDPDVTPQVLDILDRYAAQASFFCIGEKAARYPDLCREIVHRGHAVENHSQHHHWFTYRSASFSLVCLAAAVIFSFSRKPRLGEIEAPGPRKSSVAQPGELYV